MRRLLSLALQALCCAALCGSPTLAPPALAAPAAPDPGDFPPGILLSRARLNQGGGDDGANGFGNVGGVLEIFTDSTGRPLYFAKTDHAAGKSACAGSCLDKWTPALAPPDAERKGAWSIVTRDDHRRQWAFQGRALYTYNQDPEFKDDPHFSVGRTPPGRLQPIAGEGVDGVWSVATAQPYRWMKLPPGITTTENTMAPGQVLTDVSTGMALYIFGGSAARERQLPAAFRPYYAAMLSLPVGDFTLRKRDDGKLQWVYRGAPLYSCDDDLEVGDVNDKGVAPDMQPAVILRYPLPAEVALQKDQKNGGRLIDAKTGQTLYVRDRLYYSLTSNYIRGPQRLDPVVGKAIGLSGCDAECEGTWKPLIAPKDAHPRGYWTVLDRPDGRKQWAYRNYALYRHANEPPGVLYGAETWDVAFNEGHGKAPPPEHGLGLFFRAAWP